jgi:DNA-binding cell septation regulator SpoVG
MQVTDVRIRLAEPSKTPNPRIRAYAVVEIDGQLVIHDLKVVVGRLGRLIVAMPDRTAVSRCPKCDEKNPVTQPYCGHCSARLPEGRIDRALADGGRLHYDFVHPTRPTLRALINHAVLRKYAEAAGAGGGSPTVARAG